MVKSLGVEPHELKYDDDNKNFDGYLFNELKITGVRDNSNIEKKH